MATDIATDANEEYINTALSTQTVNQPLLQPLSQLSKKKIKAINHCVNIKQHQIPSSWILKS